MKSILCAFACLLCVVTKSTAQVTQLNSNKNLEVTFPLSNNKTIVVSTTDSSIWATDGTAAGTIQISPDVKFENDYALLSNKLVFRGSSSATGSEIFITDGTIAGTSLVSDIVEGTTGSDPENMVLLNGIIYFSAVTAAEGRELWRTDGVAGGSTHTYMVKDILPGAQGSLDIPAGVSDFSLSNSLFSNGSYLLFAAKTPSLGIELFKSDGTQSGTNLLKDISAMADSSNPHFFFKYNNLVFFIATDTAHGEEIWKTDGTPGGTVLLKDINPGVGSSTKYVISPPMPPIPENSFPVFQGIHVFKDRFYFNATTGNSPGDIWSSDGTEANTQLLKQPISGLSFSFITDAVNFPNKFIFPVSNFNNRSELWESDGTMAGTKIFKEFPDAEAGTYPSILLTNGFDISTQTVTQPLFQGNKFFFIGGSAAEGHELWVSDGVDSTPAHTHIVKDISAGEGDGIVSESISYVFTSTALFFAANNNVDGTELWRTDGADGSTAMVADIYPFIGNSDPDLPFFLINGKIIFSADNGDAPPGNRDLYVVDGNFTPLPVRLYEFTVALKTGDALLRWSTLNEINTKDFTIQRSYDGQHFVSIGTVAAANNASAKHDYTFTDVNPGNNGDNIIYYRILSADKDGKSQSTNIISIKLKGSNQWMVRLLSNPVKNFANVMLTGINGNVKISIKDLNGRIVYANTRQNINGQISIPLATLQRGMYVLVTEANKEIKTIQFIKQ